MTRSTRVQADQQVVVAETGAQVPDQKTILKFMERVVDAGELSPADIATFKALAQPTAATAKYVQALGGELGPDERRILSFLLNSFDLPNNPVLQETLNTGLRTGEVTPELVTTIVEQTGKMSINEEANITAFFQIIAAAGMLPKASLDVWKEAHAKMVEERTAFDTKHHNRFNLKRGLAMVAGFVALVVAMKVPAALGMPVDGNTVAQVLQMAAALGLSIGSGAAATKILKPGDELKKIAAYGESE